MYLRNSLIYQYWYGVLEKHPEKFITSFRDVIEINKGNLASEYSRAIEDLLRFVLRCAQKDLKEKLDDLRYVFRGINMPSEKLAKAVATMIKYEEKLAFVEDVLGE